MFMTISCILSERLRLKRKGLSDLRVLLITKNKYGFAAHFLERFIKSSKPIPDKRLNTIC